MATLGWHAKERGHNTRKLQQQFMSTWEIDNEAHRLPTFVLTFTCRVDMFVYVVRSTVSVNMLDLVASVDPCPLG